MCESSSATLSSSIGVCDSMGPSRTGGGKQDTQSAIATVCIARVPVGSSIVVSTTHQTVSVNAPLHIVQPFVCPYEPLVSKFMATK